MKHSDAVARVDGLPSVSLGSFDRRVLHRFPEGMLPNRLLVMQQFPIAIVVRSHDRFSLAR